MLKQIHYYALAVLAAVCLNSASVSGENAFSGLTSNLGNVFK